MGLKPASAAEGLKFKSLVGLYARPTDFVVSHGKGCYLFDTHGKQYLDLTAGIAVNALGHGDKNITQLCADQAGKLVHLSNLYHNEPATRLATLITESLVCGKQGCKGLAKCGCEKTPLTGAQIFFSNSGTEANEGAFKFCRKYAKHHSSDLRKDKKINILSFHNAFHGRSMGALSATPNPKYQKPFLPLVPGFSNVAFNDAAAAKQSITDDTCAVIVEPVQGEGGIHVASTPFLQTLRTECDRVGALLIFDEIQCGVGRTGSLFGYQTSGVVPDIITMAKPLANGVPIGAIVVGPHVADALKVGDHGTTFGGSPFATRIGEYVWKTISDPIFLNHVQSVGSYFQDKCNNLKAHYSSLITDVRGIGLMIGIELAKNIDPNEFILLCRKYNVLVISASGNTIRLVPPLIITKQQVDDACFVFDKVLNEIQTKSSRL